MQRLISASQHSHLDMQGQALIFLAVFIVQCVCTHTHNNKHTSSLGERRSYDVASGECVIQTKMRWDYARNL